MVSQFPFPFSMFVRTKRFKINHFRACADVSINASRLIFSKKRTLIAIVFVQSLSAAQQISTGLVGANENCSLTDSNTLAMVHFKISKGF